MSHTPRCTCRIVQTKTVISRPLTKGDFAIDQCDLHAAAPELLAALKGLMPLVDDTATYEAYQKEFDRASQTLLHAEAKE